LGNREWTEYGLIDLAFILACSALLAPINQINLELTKRPWGRIVISINSCVSLAASLLFFTYVMTIFTMDQYMLWYLNYAIGLLAELVLLDPLKYAILSFTRFLMGS
jgi:hypothetical protein